LKFLVFDEWDVTASLNRIRGKNEYLKKYGHPIQKEEVQTIIDTNMFRVQGFDKYGRAVAWIQAKRMLPGKHGVDSYLKFIVYS
jgi:hypothetical protein